MSTLFTQADAPRRSMTALRLWASLVVMAGCLSVAMGVSSLNPRPPAPPSQDSAVQGFDALVTGPRDVQGPQELERSAGSSDAETRAMADAAERARSSEVLARDRAEIEDLMRRQEEAMRNGTVITIQPPSTVTRARETMTPSTSDSAIRSQIVGRWTSEGASYSFLANGRFESTSNCPSGDWAISGGRIFMTCHGSPTAPNAIVRFMGVMHGNTITLEAQRVDRAMIAIELRSTFSAEQSAVTRPQANQPVP